MSLKKKLVVSTMAVSMVAASVAGLPLSTKGLAQQLGLVGTASAASVSTDSVKSKIKAIYDKLTATERATLLAYQNEVAGLDEATYEEIFANILLKLKLTDAEVTTSYNLFQSVSSVVYDVYADDFAEIKAIRLDTNNVSLLKAIAAKAKVDDLSFDDINEFMFGTSGVEAELRKLVSSKTNDQLFAIITSPAGQDELLDQALTTVLNLRTGDKALTVSEAVYNLNITTADVRVALNKLTAELPTAKPALKALAFAYVRAYGFGNGDVNPGNGGGGGGGGGGVVVVTPPVLTPGTVDLSSKMQVVNDTATLNWSDSDAIKAFDALVAANVGKTDLTLTLNLGTITAATVEVPLSKAIIEAAKARGISNIAITFNGLTVTIPVSQFSASVALTVNTVNENAATAASKLKLASKVYDFKLTVDGVVTTSFKRPIQFKLPLKSVPGLDKELLSVAKIVYNDLQFQGGKVDGEFIVEPRDTFSSYAVFENKVTFNDIASVKSWAGREIEVVAAKGAIEGIGAGKFAPKSNVTRAEFAKMLIRALDLENNSATQSFKDVSSSAWYAPYVAVAAEKGIITGRSASQFDPNATITRAEMATMISRALKSLNPSATTNATAISKFSDAAKISASLRDGVAFATANNLVIGNAGKFNPNNTATRAEAAVIIYRTINFK